MVMEYGGGKDKCSKEQKTEGSYGSMRKNEGGLEASHAPHSSWGRVGPG